MKLVHVTTTTKKAIVFNPEHFLYAQLQKGEKEVWVVLRDDRNFTLSEEEWIKAIGQMKS